MRILPLFLLSLSTLWAAEPVITHSFLATGSTTYIYEEKVAAPIEQKVTTPEPKVADNSDKADRVFEDFERATWAPWTTEGTAFGEGPVEIKKMREYQGDVNAVGKFVVQSHHTRKGETVGEGDAHLGTLTSPEFTIDFPILRMRVGGGNHEGKTCIELLVDETVVRSLTGDAKNYMRDREIDVGEFKGKKARIRVADRVKEGWGNISLDQVVFAHSAKSAEAESQIETGPRTGSKGGVVWSAPYKSRDGWVLASGNVLLALGGSKKYPGGAVIELTRSGEMVFEYKGRQKEIQAVQLLENGRILCVEGGPNPVLLELNRHTAKAVIEVPLDCQKPNIHMQTRMARKLANGNYLAPHLLDFAVKEYDASGKVVNTFATDDQGKDKKSWPFTAIRLDNGNTLVGCTYAARVVEFDPAGKIVWQITNDDLPEPLIKDACGVQRLPNGNTVICAYGARGADAVKLIEVTPEKKIVWTHKSGNKHGIHHVQILSTNGTELSARERSMK